jgi:hypothetical protein
VEIKIYLDDALVKSISADRSPYEDTELFVGANFEYNGSGVWVEEAGLHSLVAIADVGCWHPVWLGAYPVTASGRSGVVAFIVEVPSKIRVLSPEPAAYDGSEVPLTFTLNEPVSEAKSLSDPSASSIVVDYETGVGVWGFLVTERQIEGVNGDNLYVGALCSFDVSNGTVLRTYKFQSSCDLSDNKFGLAPGRDVFYLTAGLDVWSVDKASGEATMLQRYEHIVQKPVLYDGTIYIAADLHLSAYR